MNILKILSKIRDPFGEAARRQEEYQLLRTLKQARVREKILISAIANGESVQEELEKTKAQVLDLTNRMPRGDNLSFCVLCLWCILTITILVRVYFGLQDIIVEMWGLPEHWSENWYLQRYRLGSAKIWLVGHFLMSSIWSAVVIVLLLSLLWYIQRRLQQRYARTLNTIVTAIEIFAVLIFGCAAFRLLMLPLG